MSARTLLEEYYRVVWTEGHLDAIERFFAPDARAEGILPPASADLEDLRVMAQTARGLVRRPQFRILRFVEDGDWACALCVFEGRAVSTGEFVSVQGQVMFRVMGDVIVEAHNNYDMLGACVQLGSLSADALPALLAGQPVA